MDIAQVDAYNEEVARQRAQRDAVYAEYEKAGRIWGLVPRERITKIRFERVLGHRPQEHCYPIPLPAVRLSRLLRSGLQIGWVACDTGDQTLKPVEYHGRCTTSLSVYVAPVEACGSSRPVLKPGLRGAPRSYDRYFPPTITSLSIHNTQHRPSVSNSTGRITFYSKGKTNVQFEPDVQVPCVPGFPNARVGEVT